jgi:CIC family chloride channel protein
MIFELTRDYTIIVPLMLSNMISYFISYRYQPKAIYEALAEQDGIHLPTAATQQRQGRLQVRRAMKAPSEVLDAEMTPSEALERVVESRARAWPVLDRRGFLGMLTAEELKKAIEADPEGTLKEVARLAPDPHLHSDHLLDLALERMGKAHVSVLPVVSRLDVRRLEGMVAREDVMKVYGFESTDEE